MTEDLKPKPNELEENESVEETPVAPPPLPTAEGATVVAPPPVPTPEPEPVAAQPNPFDEPVTFDSPTPEPVTFDSPSHEPVTFDSPSQSVNMSNNPGPQPIQAPAPPAVDFQSNPTGASDVAGAAEPPKKKNNTVLIIVIVAAVLLLCCCILGIIGIVSSGVLQDYMNLANNQYLPLLQ